MRSFTLPLILAASVGLTAPATAQDDFGDVIGGIAQTLIQQELDRNAYVEAQTANSAAAYRDYLARFPKGQYRVNAQRALERLGAPVEGSTAAAAQIETRLGISFAQRVAVQRELTRLGYQTYGTDGVWGRNTRTAIAAWQRDRKERATGYVTEVQVRELLRRAAVTPPADTGGTTAGTVSAARTEAALQLTRTQRVTIQRQLGELGYQGGVADGLWGSKTRAAIKAWQQANRRAATGYVTQAQVRLIAQQATSAAPPAEEDEDGAALEERLLGLTLAERVDTQRRLRRLGYDPLRTDGTFGAGTRRAIAEWQADEGVEETGYLTADQFRLIRVETGG